MAELLLELLSEEIPARMQTRAAEDLAKMVGEGLSKQGLTFKAPLTYVTPRRLALVIQDLPQATPDISEERRGPRVGSPEQALEGFLKGAGVTLDQCEQRDTGKGIFYFAVIAKSGRPTAEVIKDVVEQTMAAFPWPKSMRWGSGAARWVRPLQSIICLFDGTVVPVEFGGIKAGNQTRGHRFLAPDAFEVSDVLSYVVNLSKAYVMLDPKARREEILEQARDAAKAAGLTLKEDDGLLAEVSGLVEWPTVLTGSFDEGFMEVPDEVLVTSMRSHQKYFSLLKSDGRLANRFLVVANMPAFAADQIISGNQRVLRARLSDAKFFWDTDLKHPLDSWVPKLADRLYYQGLGTVADKAARLSKLAGHIARSTGADPVMASRAGYLAKADLSSDMVGEFPELQGLMGRYYALKDKESGAVADAIGQHYSPLGPTDSCPTAPVSVAVALADKIDTLVGFFGINEKPTGSKDPFALRRAALGIIRLILENGVRLSLRDVLEYAHGLYAALPTDATTTANELTLFFADRLKNHLRDKGVGHDRIAAAFRGTDDDLFRVEARAKALDAFLASDDGRNLLIAYRRAANIVRIEHEKDGVPYLGSTLQVEVGMAEEVDLNIVLNKVEHDTGAAGETFAAAMSALARLRAPVDAFFDKVTVNSAEADERTRRLSLLGRIVTLMNNVADFSAIEG
jgi:glycyl-tRNA synthetase beta chain